MKFINILPAFILICLPCVHFAQNMLSLPEAMNATLENNYGIRVAKNDVATARNNTSKAFNGYFPTVNASAGPSASFGGSTQKFNGSLGEAEVQNAFSWSAAASIAANYTIFDKTRDYTLDQLKEVLTLTDLQLRQTMEANLLQLFNAYYEMARLSENIQVLEQTFEVSSRRLQRAEYRYEYGQGIRLDVLNAQVDIQRDSINLLNTRQQLANARRNLNVIMGVPVDRKFVVDTTVAYASNLSEAALVADAMTQNIAILASDQNLEISELDLKILDAGRKPTIGARTSYDYNYQDNAAGSFIASSRSSGLNAGVTLNWNIFDGGRRKVLEENTRIAIESQLIRKAQLQEELERDVRNAWDSYQNALFVLQVEENSLSTNRLNLERTQEQFRSGQISSVEFRQAQLNLLNAATNYNLAKYNAKLIELQLLQLSGRLLDGRMN